MDTQPSDLAALLEAGKAELPECSCNTPWHTTACALWQAKLARGEAEDALAALAPVLARKVLDQRRAGQALARALQHGSLVDQGEALDRWAELTETEPSDG